MSFVSLFILFTTSFMFGQTTAFNYQGSLQTSGSPANGNYDFEFLLFSAASGGSQIGSTQTRNGVSVTNGIFSVNLDFGSQFPGADRFLEIRVRQAGSGGHTILDPRQRMSSTPYSVRSLTAANATSADTAANATNAATAANALQLGGVAASSYLQRTATAPV